MSPSQIPPNKLADRYESLYTLLECLPADTHPAWELAVESVLFGGEGLAPDVTCYGEQQAEQNNFSISAYRAQYGDGDRVVDFPTLTTSAPAKRDRQYVEKDVELPITPESESVLPLFVDDETLSEAVALLNEFPPAPGSASNSSSSSMLLNANRLPGITADKSDLPSENGTEAVPQTATDNGDLSPNELADYYDGIYTLLDAIPETAHPCWQEAVETILFGGEYLCSDASSYGEQQSERNKFGMTEYRTQYGDGSRVTDFPTIPTATPVDDKHFVDSELNVPVAPKSETVLPLAPTSETILDALSLLAELPATPDGDLEAEYSGSLLDIDALRTAFEEQISTQDPPEATSTEQTATEETATTQSNSQSEPSSSKTSSPTTLRAEDAGESSSAIDGETESDGSRKYADPEAERAHRRAQQRDPSDIVELGDKITLTLKQVDYSSRPPTIMGTKNRLVIFVVDAPQDLAEYDTIRATVVDYGGKNNSAEAAFSGYS